MLQANFSSYSSVFIFSFLGSGVCFSLSPASPSVAFFFGNALLFSACLLKKLCSLFLVNPSPSYRMIPRVVASPLAAFPSSSSEAEAGGITTMAGKSVIPYFFRMSWFGFVVRTSANRIRRRNSVDRCLVNGDVLGCDIWVK